MKERSSIENELYLSGFNNIAGIDEAGRGPLAGPVVASACIIHKEIKISVSDSKKLSPIKRKEIFNEIISNKKIIYAVGIVDNHIIDKINILQATFMAMKNAISKLRLCPDFLLFDGNSSPENLKIPHKSIIKGDSICMCIAAASIISKVIRDDIMTKHHERWPFYGFDKHKGYPTKQHYLAIKEHGALPIHRVSFKGVLNLGYYD